MNELPLAEYGVAIFSIATMGIMLYTFLKHLSKKDDNFTTTVKDFNVIITNHLSEDKEIKEKLIASNNSLEKTLDRIANKL